MCSEQDPPKKTPALVIQRWAPDGTSSAIRISPSSLSCPWAQSPLCLQAQLPPRSHLITGLAKSEPRSPNSLHCPICLAVPEASPCRNDMNTRTLPDPSAKQQSVAVIEKPAGQPAPKPGLARPPWPQQPFCQLWVHPDQRSIFLLILIKPSSSSRSGPVPLPPHKRWRR